SAAGRNTSERGGWISAEDIQSCRTHVAVVSMTVVGSVTTSAREFQALMALPVLSPALRSALLQPAPRSAPPLRPEEIPREISVFPERVAALAEAWAPPVGGQPTIEVQREPPPGVPASLWRALAASLNLSQLRAVRAVTEGGVGGVTLLQGPPGTGKTSTILALLAALLVGACPTPPSHLSKSRKRRGPAAIIPGAALATDRMDIDDSCGNFGGGIVQRRPERVLVCAPSNAAVDEIVLRLRTDGLVGPDGERFFPPIVRVTGDGGGGGGSGRDGGAGLEVDPRVAEVSLDVVAQKQWDAIQCGSRALCRLDALCTARIVLATLSGVASEKLVQAALGPDGSGGGAGGGVGGGGGGKSGGDRRRGELYFDALIVDEAAQAVEPSVLIPFKHNPHCVVLVGDHKQLPATVFSNDVAAAEYGRSLFQRLSSGGHPVVMLDTQYRMHPEVR
ncbi:unnamed protein product, partial [Phaeothamnion confervicola]